MGKKFKKNTRRRAKEYEKDLVKYWKNNNTFERSVSQRPEDDRFVFYDGPPFITGVPHHGTLLSSIVKDAVPRFWTMKGKRVERRWGWDCHGLPAEVFTEKKLGIQDKREIGTKISLEEYIVTCRDNMVQTGDLWEDTIDRIGRWVNFKGAYKTMDKEYMESVWWAFKELYEKGKIYEGERVLMYCTRDATPLAKAEIAMDNSYQMDTDPSVYVKFKLANEEKYLLAWTTTPWTLPSNSAIAVNRDLTYADVKIAEQVFILAEALIERVLTDEKHQVIPYEVLRTYRGSELEGATYEPLFEPAGALLDSQNAFKVWHADFVHADEGTGIAHESPAYGEEDYELSRQHDIPWVMSTDESGYFTMGPWKGKNVWEVNKQIAKDMHASDGGEPWHGSVWKIDYIRHKYPHCYRCGTKLMYRAHPSWFLDVQGQKERMLELNQDITWFPEHIKDGRFKKTVESAPDWNISRDRFWATAMPVWKGVDADGNVHTKVVGSYAELKELSGVELEDYHRPWIDDVTFKIDGVEYRRIDKVLDCWFESGSMPFAQFHYPFENREEFENSFPSDFIVEYVGQVRAWFYYMHAVATALFDNVSFKNVIVTGSVAGNDGRKMSKSYGNYTDPNELMDNFSADSLRFLLLSSPLLNGEDFSLQDKEVGDTARKLSMVWNMYDFFTLYADVDDWEWDGSYDDPLSTLSNSLDRWIVSKVHILQETVDEYMQEYDLPNALKPILPFIDDASNWYVRRSRKRFWKSGNDLDKQDAYKTLHYVLVRLSHILAPFTPFLAEELYRKLTDGESVHLQDWPQIGGVDEEVNENMDRVRDLINIGLGVRAKQGIKVRQPLSGAVLQQRYATLPDEMIDILKEELNIKTITIKDSKVDSGKTFKENIEEDNFQQLHHIELDLNITPELRREGIMRDIVRFVQNARKKAGLNIDDRIALQLVTESEEVSLAVKEHQKTIQEETLAHTLNDAMSIEGSYEEVASVSDSPLKIRISKV